MLLVHPYFSDANKLVNNSMTENGISENANVKGSKKYLPVGSRWR
jgi:hypothetical protein